MRIASRLVAAVFGLAVLWVAVGGAGHAVEARRAWCRQDPIISINGTVVRIDIAIPAEAPALVNGVAVTTVRVPAGTDVQVLSVDQTYFAERVEVVYDDASHTRGGPIPVEVSVLVPGAERFPVDLSLQWRENGSPATARGYSNEVVSRSFRFN